MALEVFMITGRDGCRSPLPACLGRSYGEGVRGKDHRPYPAVVARRRSTARRDAVLEEMGNMTGLTAYIDAPVKDVFTFFKDPANWDELPSADFKLTKAAVTREGVGTHFAGTFKLVGLPVDFFEVYTEVVPNKRITEWSSMPFTGSYIYSFDPEGSGTRLTIDIEPRSFWRFPLLRMLVERVMSGQATRVMAELKAKLEGVAAARPRAAA
jgi:hypothetical protein